MAPPERRIPPTPRPTPASPVNTREGSTDYIKEGLNTLRDFASGVFEPKAQNPNGINRPVSGMDSNKTMRDADKLLKD